MFEHQEYMDIRYVICEVFALLTLLNNTDEETVASIIRRDSFIEDFNPIAELINLMTMKMKEPQNGYRIHGKSGNESYREASEKLKEGGSIMICEYNIEEKDFSGDLIFLMNKLRLISLTLDQVSEGVIPLPDPGGDLSEEEKQELEYTNPVVGATQFIDEITDDLKVIHKALYLKNSSTA